MLNNLKIAFRSIRRNKISSFVNIAGLAMGMAAFLLLIEYISLEKSVNKFHADLPRMYRLINEDPAGKTWPEVEPGWAAIAKQRFPGIKDYCRFNEETGAAIVNVSNSRDQSFSETKTGYADGNFFNFFTFSLKSGNAASLNKANVVFISETIAKKYFGHTDPINQKIILNNQFGRMDYTVAAVFADMKENSDLQYSMLFSLETLKNAANLNGNSWAATDNLSSQYIYTFFLLNKDVDTKVLQNKLSALRNELKADKDGVRFRLQAFSDIHLGSSVNDTYPTAANLKYVYMLGGISLLILLIAWFNYINLSTANSVKRAGEVGIRKVIGASKGNLVLQFMSESFLINLLGFVFAILLVSLLQPFFNKLIGKEISLEILTSSTNWIYGLSFLFIGSLLSGAYTAFTLAGFKPVETLKGKMTKT